MPSVGSRKSRKSRKSGGARRPAPKQRVRKTRVSLPKTARVMSRKSASRARASRADSAMSMTDLQFMAKSKGIPFGGLTKQKLIKKINNYY